MRSRVLLSYPNPPPFLLFLPPHAAKPPAVLTSGKPSRPNGGGSTISMTMQRRLSPACRHSDDVDEMDGFDDVTFINGQSKQGSSRMVKGLGFDDKYALLRDYLSTFGLGLSDFISIYERRSRLPTDVTIAQQRLEFLLDVGVKKSDVKRILRKHPQILEYSLEKNLKPHVDFLRSIGIPESRIGSTISAVPSLFSYSIELSLEPAVKYMIEEIGIKPDAVGKVVHLSPDTLFRPTGDSWNARLSFLSKELLAPRNAVVKMVTAHPQLLHYSIENKIKPRVDFFRSIGMSDSEILKVLTSLPQVLSISTTKNLQPKCSYLTDEIGNDVHSLARCPQYFSLSLDQRIRPRHRFLLSLRRRRRTASFPLGAFMPSDERFCKHWARTSLEKYLAFRRSLLLRKK